VAGILPKAAAASAFVREMALSSVASECTTRIPRPPPPPAALMMTGYPISRANSSVRLLSPSSGPSEPGTQGTQACFMARMAETLSPIRRMVSGFGPMKMKPERSTRSAKSAFSLRKP
jgi:hypothetical protein